MSPFVRLQEGDGNETERLLLASAAEDAPSPGAREKTLLALGVVAGAGIVAEGTAHAVVHAATGSASTKAAGSMTTLVLAKWLGAGAAIGAVTAACIATATTPGPLFPSHRTRPSVESAAPAAPRAPAPRVRPPEPAAAPGVTENAAVEAPGDVPAAASAPARASRSAAVDDAVAASATDLPAPGQGASPGSASNVLAEVASLDRARAALAAGDAKGALDRLAAHERRFPGGTLEPEAVVVRVRALLLLGQRTEAAAFVNRFLAEHPDSSQAARLRALVGTLPR